MEQAQQRWHQKQQKECMYQEGDYILLDGCNVKMYHLTAKLALKRHGPFKITKVLSAIMYQLELPVKWKLHPMFHVDLLTPYRETVFHSANYNKPPPDLIDGEEEYKVEHVVSSQHHGSGGHIQYLVKWKGYPDAENQWINQHDMGHAEEAIAEF